MSSSILAGLDLHRALETGKIFVPGTWDSSQIRSSGYDIRVARDLMVLPGEDGRVGRVFREGEFHNAEVLLQPGQSAFFSSEEKLQLGWDLTGTIGAKFALSAKGLLLLTGMIVDPGYGLRRSTSGEWFSPGADRLRFIVANVGPATIVFRPGVDSLAAVQFTKIPTVPEQMRREVRSIGFDSLADSLLSEDRQNDAGLAFFRSVRDLRVNVEDIDARVTKAVSTVEDYDKRLDRIESATNTVVLFGVYLIAVTILGIVVGNFPSWMKAALEGDSVIGKISVIASGAVYAVAAIGGLIAVVVAVIKSRRR
ncbi:dCTP deaminase domain-containing protein [Microbacterium sp. ASV81]|uniref:Deoxycytidine triphosphate deaminase n=1 Tax=Microbacterium capsulatum TaxID=3041921 RepID=A0ABU0XF24_9MICO|nr:hypothetical protein [Microbacterium sp. ASV81]MDQ4213722.1 hypothetical protein [Microbacterium sp. ASV81]